MGVRDYSGGVRPIDSVHEAAGRRRVEWDADGSIYRGTRVPGDADGSIYRGYEMDDGRLHGACMVPSAARLAALSTENAARAATEAQIATFRQSIRDLAQQVKDSGGLTVAQRLALLSQLTVKLARLADNILADL